MKQSLLHLEPPLRILREKEVSKKKDKTLNHIMISLKNNKNRNNSNLSKKCIEREIKTNIGMSFVDKNYSNLEKNFMEEDTTSTSENIKFSKTKIESNNLIQYFEYKGNELISTTEDDREFYGINFNYSFNNSQTFIKDNNKKENNYSESKEQEKKDVIYNLRPFEEDKQSEEMVIEWNVKAYN